MFTILLVLIRTYEDQLFYDPLLSFFKEEGNTETLPVFNSLQLLGNVILRFLMNTILSLAILWVLFEDKGFIKLTVYLYAILFFIVFTAYCYLLYYSESDTFLTLFYVRRFLIQPLFLLILIPAFYYYKNRKIS